MEPEQGLSPYAVTANIGQGRTGAMRRARDTKLDRLGGD